MRLSSADLHRLARIGGGNEFPNGWDRTMTDTAYWQPTVEAICATHGLPSAGTLTPGVEGSNAVFLSGEFVVKIYAAPWPIWFAREVECLRALEAVPTAKAPRLLASGSAAGGDSQHPYLVMERLPGEPLSHLWETLSLSEKCAIAEQVGVRVRALHDTPVEGLTAFPTAPAEWIRLMRARIEMCDTFREEYHLPARLMEQVRPYLEQNEDALAMDFRPRLLSADLHGDHILIEKQDGKWRVTGQIDFGDAEVGPVEYEWFALCMDAFRGDKKVMCALFAAYGWPLPMDALTRQRVKLFMLLHRFPDIGRCAHVAGVALEDAPTLDALLDTFWPD